MILSTLVIFTNAIYNASLLSSHFKAASQRAGL